MSNADKGGPSWQDVWDAAAAVDDDFRPNGFELVVRPPFTTAKGTHLPHAGVRCWVNIRGEKKELGRWRQVGGKAGARTFPAAFLQTLTELYARLEELAEDAAGQASF